MYEIELWRQKNVMFLLFKMSLRSSTTITEKVTKLKMSMVKPISGTNFITIKMIDKMKSEQSGSSNLNHPIRIIESGSSNPNQIWILSNCRNFGFGSMTISMSGTTLPVPKWNYFWISSFKATFWKAAYNLKMYCKRYQE